jgi:hypothetical protein
VSNSKLINHINGSIQKLALTNPNLSTNRLRVVVALERAVARLQTQPKLADHLIFKGGFVLFKVMMNPRFTRDVDAIALDIHKSDIPDLVVAALETDLNDGLWFGDVQTEDLNDQGVYGGYRFSFAFQIGAAPDPLDVLTGLKAGLLATR